MKHLINLEERSVGIMRRTLSGLLMSIVLGGVCLFLVFPDGVGYVMAVYAIPFILLYGIPVSLMTHALTFHEQRFVTLKRLIIFVTMGGWLFALISLFYFVKGLYTNDPFNFLIFLSMFFALCFWLGEEVFERTKLKEWTNPDLTKV